MPDKKARLIFLSFGFRHFFKVAAIILTENIEMFSLQP